MVLPSVRSGFFCILLPLVSVLGSPSAGDKPKSASPSLTLAGQRLSQIVERQEEFLKRTSDPARPLSESELTRRAQALVTAYETYLDDNPEDAYALILYGKFLRRMGQDRQAAGLFLEADKVDPRLAVVKQHLANYLVEEGRPADALPFMLKAVELEPKEPAYHHQLGVFLFLFGEDLVDLGVTTAETNANGMHDAFRAASELSPGNFEYKLRYAQSFFDAADPNWDKALTLWRGLRREASNRPEAEREYLAMGEARVLAELRRPDEAKALLRGIRSSALRTTKESLEKQLDALGKPKENVFPKPEANMFHRQTDGVSELLADDNLNRLRAVSERLEQEKLLRELRVDAVRAAYDGNGNVRLRVSGFAETLPGANNSAPGLAPNL